MSKTTQPSAEKENPLQAKNEAITTAYQNILNEVKQVLPQYPTEYLRTFVEVDYNSLGIKCKHGFFSPLIHLQLEDNEGSLIIAFSRNLAIKSQVGNHLDGLLSRIVYKHTAEANTAIFIEDSLSADAYKVDDFRQATNLISKGFKDGKKVTV
jgi:hypothetical protein